MHGGLMDRGGSDIASGQTLTSCLPRNLPWSVIILHPLTVRTGGVASNTTVRGVHA